MASDKIREDMKQLNNFSLDSMDFSSGDSYTKAMWGGDTGVAAAAAGVVDQIVEFGSRARHKVSSYSETELGAAAAGATAAPRGDRTIKRAVVVKAPVMHDFQFYSKSRIEAIVALENELLARKRDLLALLKVRAVVGWLPRGPPACAPPSGLTPRGVRACVPPSPPPLTPSPPPRAPTRRTPRSWRRTRARTGSSRASASASRRG